ncbi:MAG: peptide chain release factor N(5)-glutamine methyltransferase [Propionibacteriales bacterium]|nr:peptide chain release factor N(5)-glutamine methyltransferase [Propionibacteriales bacterium]
MMSVGALVHAGAATLGSAAEARTLLAHAAGVDTSRLELLDGVDSSVRAEFDALVERRLAGEPLQYLTGGVGFRTVEVSVGPGVFIPRPETEVMTGWAIAALAELERPIVVELCAGSGAISLAIAAERPGCRQFAVELSGEAAAYAAENLAATEVDLRIGDMAGAFAELDGQVDLVIANPPYVPLRERQLVGADVVAHEPELAVFSGHDGLDALKVVAVTAARLLRPGGVVCAEHAESHAADVVALFSSCGDFVEVCDHHDLTDRPRFVSAVRAQNLAG